MHAQTHAHTLIRGRDQREQEGEMSGSVYIYVCVCVCVRACFAVCPMEQNGRGEICLQSYV